ncbi:glycosyltransferase family 2 protein [Flammeovirga sp. EKP202]|uniref:glycosyltransferase family 2 protein n=1 Tax=Flammeovirga sp. EKP202 TaxID=2770592 RepID=UPI00165F2103|nr:glycosyltransferase family 2 protein [Flammeovirga sp. EKP202]MBD0404288.1 glycosyltransferase [Flammeovirga sp. EKP202]
MVKISVITISYNCENEIEDTIQSVIQQDYPNLEYIVVDGASKDKTPEIIEKYKESIHVAVSEKDKGIYDAMNKGAQLASGDWVIYMNAGDIFYEDSTISQMFAQLQPAIQLLYGNHEVVYEHLTKIKKAVGPNQLWKGMVCSHQALFVKRDLLIQFPFEWEKWNISADFHFIFNRWYEGAPFQHVDIFVAKFAAGGLSDLGSIDSKMETWKIVKEKMDTPEVDEYYTSLIKYEKYVNLLRKTIPNFAFEKLMKLKNIMKGADVK